MLRVAINGFGRIGRTAFRILSRREGNTIVAINDPAGAATAAHLLKYDSNYGVFEQAVTHDDESLTVNGRAVKVLATKDATILPWGELGVDVVIEATGKYLEREAAKQHLDVGAKAVVITAPGKGDQPPAIFIRGVNDQDLHRESIISNASCTTNSLAPTMQVLDAAFGVESALMTTVHAYTGDQRLQDADHKDLRRARAAAANIIPTTTGAAIAVTKAIPSLDGKFDGIALRVPVTVGSISDITAILKKEATVAEINAAFTTAANEPRYQGILTVTNDPIVSSDIVGSPYSAIVDLGLTRAVGNLIKVFAWYDNEYGYTMRLVEMVEEVGQHLATESPTA